MNRKFAVTLGLFSTLSCSMCASYSAPELTTSHELAERKLLNIDELTPTETKRFDSLLNREVSPCGNDVSLGQAIAHASDCPLLPGALSYITSLLQQDYDVEEISARYNGRFASLKGLDIPIADSPVTGAAAPVIRLVVFSDFECPHCARTAEVLRRLVRSYPDKIQLIYKNFPLSEIHPSAELAARAGYAAHRQKKFWEMHDTMYSVQGSGITPDKLRTMAIGLGLNVDEFEEQLASQGAAAAISQDIALGEELGVSGTPQIFVNGRPLEGGESVLEARIQEEFLRQAFHKP